MKEKSETGSGGRSRRRSNSTSSNVKKGMRRSGKTDEEIVLRYGAEETGVEGPFRRRLWEMLESTKAVEEEEGFGKRYKGAAAAAAAAAAAKNKPAVSVWRLNLALRNGNGNGNGKEGGGGGGGGGASGRGGAMADLRVLEERVALSKTGCSSSSSFMRNLGEDDEDDNDVVDDDDDDDGYGVHCEHCTSAGWSSHPVCSRQYHFIIPQSEKAWRALVYGTNGQGTRRETDAAEFGGAKLSGTGGGAGGGNNGSGTAAGGGGGRKRKGPGGGGGSGTRAGSQNGGGGGGGSCSDRGKHNNGGETALSRIVSCQTHLLHGVLHSNGYGHLLRLNGREGGSRGVDGKALMTFWDKLCRELHAREVTVQDVSRKHAMELRLMHTAMFGKTWYGEWGYSFHRGSFGVTETGWKEAVETLNSATVGEVLAELEHFRLASSAFRKVMAKHVDGRSRKVTLASVLRLLNEMRKKELMIAHGHSSGSSSGPAPTPTAATTAAAATTTTLTTIHDKATGGGKASARKSIDAATAAVARRTEKDAADMSLMDSTPSLRIEIAASMLHPPTEIKAMSGAPLSSPAAAAAARAKASEKEKADREKEKQAAAAAAVASAAAKREKMEDGKGSAAYMLTPQHPTAFDVSSLEPFAVAKNCRWHARRVIHAAEAVISTLLESKMWLPRQELRDRARGEIGDTGLLDFVLKSIGNTLYQNTAIVREFNQFTKIYEYFACNLGGQAAAFIRSSKMQTKATKARAKGAAGGKAGGGGGKSKAAAGGGGGKSMAAQATARSSALRRADALKANITTIYETFAALRQAGSGQGNRTGSIYYNSGSTNRNGAARIAHAIQVLIDCKLFMKDYTEPTPIESLEHLSYIPRKGSLRCKVPATPGKAGILSVFAKVVLDPPEKAFCVEASNNRLAESAHVSGPMDRYVLRGASQQQQQQQKQQLSQQQRRLCCPPPELIYLPSDATVGDLKDAAVTAFHELYEIFNKFTPTSVEGVDPGPDVSDSCPLGPAPPGSTYLIRGTGADVTDAYSRQGGIVSWVVRCSCGVDDDDGERFVSCDVCEVWEHTRCVGIRDDAPVPSRWVCELCRKGKRKRV